MIKHRIQDVNALIYDNSNWCLNIVLKSWLHKEIYKSWMVEITGKSLHFESPNKKMPAPVDVIKVNKITTS